MKKETEAFYQLVDAKRCDCGEPGCQHIWVTETQRSLTTINAYVTEMGNADLLAELLQKDKK